MPAAACLCDNVINTQSLVPTTVDALVIVGCEYSSP